MIGIDLINWQTRIANNFSSVLFGLISKADMENKDKLQWIYPVHVALYDWWMEQDPAPTNDDIIKKGEDLMKSYAVT